MAETADRPNLSGEKINQASYYYYNGYPYNEKIHKKEKRGKPKNQPRKLQTTSSYYFGTSYYNSGVSCYYTTMTYDSTSTFNSYYGGVRSYYFYNSTGNSAGSYYGVSYYY